MKVLKDRRFESKSRMLRPDWGAPMDNKYWASSGSWWYADRNSKDALRGWMETSYRTGMSNRATPIAGVELLHGGESINTSKGNPQGMNNCTHVKQTHVCLPFGALHSGWRGDGEFFYESFWRFGVTQPYWKDACSTAIYHGSEWNDPNFSARAYWSMRPKFKSEASLINSIFELKDFSDVASTMFGKNKSFNREIGKTVKALSKVSAAFNKSPVVTGIKVGTRALSGFTDWLSRPGAVIGDLSKLAANAQLTYSLAVMPTIRDVMTIHAESQKDVYELAKQFKEFGDEGARSHYSEHDVILNTVTGGSYNAYITGTGKYIKRTKTATMVSYYRVLWERLEKRYPYWWGLEIGADEVWNMLPLSFVLDYVWTVGKSLEYMDRDDSVEVLSHEYCESVKVVASSGTYYLQDTRTPALIIDGVYQMPRSTKTPLLVTGAVGSYYQRIVKEPYKGPALPRFKVPSSGQAANLLALARCLLF